MGTLIKVRKKMDSIEESLRRIGLLHGERKNPQVSQILERTKVMQARLAHLKMISWDMTTDNNDEVVLIEINTVGQSA